MSLMMNPYHDPVMVNEIRGLLPLKPGDVYIDGTLGLGGHALALAPLLQPNGWIIGIDWDSKMLDIAKSRIEQIPNLHLRFFQADFRQIPRIIKDMQDSDFPSNKVKGILLDLGLNNAQIEDPERGMSFRQEGPLDMRMERSEKRESAATMLNRLSAKEIEEILWEYGDERWAKRIAQVIVDRRKVNPLQTTQDLVNCVLAAIPAAKRDRRIHPATRTFQAVRIAVNRELENLDAALADIAECLAPGGVLAILSYHSGEDRIVKHVFKELSTSYFKLLYKKPVVPTESEIHKNPKSRSAKLRALQKQ